MSEPTGSIAVPDGLDAAAIPHLEAIAAAVVAGDRAAVIAAIREAPARLRVDLAPALDAWHTEQYRHQQLSDELPAWDAYRLATAGVAVTPADAAGRLRWMVMHTPGETPMRAAQYAELLGDRGRAWLTRFAVSLLASRNRNPGLTWHLVRHLVAADLIEPPTHVHHRSDVLWAYPWKELPARVAEDPSLAAALRKLFRTPGVGLVLGRTFVADVRRHVRLGDGPGSLYSDEQWTGLLAACGCDDPELRPGLLDDCLTALSGSLPDRDAPGFVAVHERLEPTIDEVADREGRYAALLLSPATATVVLARTHLRELLDADRLDGAGLLEVTNEVLLRREKGVVREHLRLLTDALAAGALDAGACADAVLASLEPERTDLALLAARLVRRCAEREPALRDRLARHVAAAVPDPTPELRKAFGPLATATAPQAPTRPVPRAWTAPLVAAPVDLPEPGRVEPVRDLAELTALLEEMHTLPATPLDVERALDGLVRLRTDPAAAQSLVTALYRRPRDVPRLDDVLRAWAGHVTPEEPNTVTAHGHVGDPAMAPDGAELTEVRQTIGSPAGPDGSTPPPRELSIGWRWRLALPSWTAAQLITSRLTEIKLGHLRQPAAPLLAAPNRDDGTLTADAFLERLHERAAVGLGTEPHDLGTALLRLRPGDRAALRDSGHLRPETAERLALLDAPLTWHRTDAVDHGRSTSHPRSVTVWQATDSPLGAPDDPVRAWLDSDQHGRMWWHRADGNGRYHPESALHVGLWALTLPSHPDVFAAHVQRLVAEALENEHADVSPVMSLLGAYRLPFGAPAVDAVLVGGATHSVRARASAAEALAEACGHGLVPAAALTAALLVAFDPVAASHGSDRREGELRPKANRVAGMLTDAARIDDATGRVVLDALVDALEPLSQFRGGVAFVELAARLAERFRARVELPEPLAALAAGRSSSRTAQEARRLAAAGDR